MAKKKIQEHKKMSPKAKKLTAGAASALLGAGIIIGGGNRPVKASTTGEDIVTTEVENKINTSQTENQNTEQETTVSQQVETTNEESDLTMSEIENASENVTDSATVVANTESTEQDVTSTEQVETAVTPENTISDGSVDTNSVANSKQETTSSSQKNEPVVEANTKSSYQDSVDKVAEINKEANNKLQAAIDKLTQDITNLGGTIDIKPGDKVDINTTVNGIDISKDKLEEHIQNQIKEFDQALADYKSQLDKYQADLTEYNQKLAEYNKKKEEYIQKLKDWGLWNDENVDLDDIKQDLVLSEDEEHTKVEAETLVNGVTIKPDTLLNTNLPFLDNLASINNNQNITGDFLKLTYTGFEKSFYGDQLIGKIEITFSDWTAKNTSHKYAGIYYGDKLTDGFFYTKGEGVTMAMKIYDRDGKQITIKPNSAYITVGSLNSEGNGSDYVEKAEIINGTDHQGQGVVIPGSSVGVHKGEGEHGGDILFSDKNNEILNYLNNGGNREDAIKIWGKDVVEEFENWDSTTNRDKEIFGCGLFQVSGNSIVIRFSNKLGSAWATYSTTVPKLSFEGVHPGEEPEKPGLEVSYSPGNLVLNANGSVHIHYVDVSGAPADLTDYEPGHGIHLDDRLQSIIHLAVGDDYANILWDWEKHGYILATTPDKIHSGATNGTIEEGEKHYYVYLTHKISSTTETVNRDKEVNQIIHYIYEDGSKAADDHVSVKLIFTQTGTKTITVNEVTGEIIESTIWDGEWTKTQTFVTVTSPKIPGFTADRLEVGPYNITVTNDNYGQNLDKEDRVVYKANPVTPDTPDPDPEPTPTPDETVDPLPEEDPSPDYPDQPEEDKNDEVVPSHAGETPDKLSNVREKVVPVKATAVSNQNSSGITEVNTKVDTVRKAEATLPQTGENKNGFASFLSALAAVLGLTGLMATSKKRKEDK
ncbi:MAG: LPXTG cell wall anchor domain-containing protein [Lactobacillus crispatus]|jgi:LPXTG-motif cell wall-anchored protein|nr:LPXTG cell wall anchor domain-containing protein [Lactobacillus crispatus]MCI1335682.1 LPXTG cell wall anchor domain-containing protein [Lactobacillus crispatus]MCI1364896.1 LPXTG cell wall anchor domain-containing protein [Lactobacillus crispatus]MCI1493742.1 LPXTG cell wall anchor domain-containing protein [Lactobacillus crispatus]MCI1538100.1 LPXTG cell wall anchor domain-containing protein [Lactobacillus crispatus]